MENPGNYDNRSLSDQHKDIEFGNTYRLEYIKHLISISTGVIIFSVTFMKDVLNKSAHDVFSGYILIISWALLLISIFSGIFHMRYWAWYFVSWGTKGNDEEAKKWRKQIDKKRKKAEAIQIYGFIFGLTLLTIFTLINLL